MDSSRFLGRMWLKVYTGFILFSLGLCRVVEVDVAAFAPHLMDTLSSLVYSRPPIEKAIEDANAQFNGTLKVSVRFISDDRNLNCSGFKSEVDNLVAKWYYRDRRPPNEAVSFIMNTGRYIVMLSHYTLA